MKVSLSVFARRWQTFYSKRHPTNPPPTRLLLQVSLTRPECGVGWGMSLVNDTEEECAAARRRARLGRGPGRPGGRGGRGGRRRDLTRCWTEGVGIACTA